VKETRAEKAQRLVDEGGVRYKRSTPFHTLGGVQGDHDFYDVIYYAGGHYFCTCPWGAQHSHTDDLCAHALAVKLAAERNEP